MNSQFIYRVLCADQAIRSAEYIWNILFCQECCVTCVIVDPISCVDIIARMKPLRWQDIGIIASTEDCDCMNILNIVEINVYENRLVYRSSLLWQGIM